MSFRDTIHVEEDDGNEVGGAKVWKILIVTFVAYTTHVLFVTQHLIILKTLLLGLISPLRFIVKMSNFCVLLLYALLEFLSISCTYHFRALSRFVDKEVSCAFQRQMSHWSSELLWQTWRAFPCPSNTLALLHLGNIRRGCRISFCLWRLWIGRVQEEGSRVHVRGATKNDDHVDAGWSKEGYSTTHV